MLLSKLLHVWLQIPLSNGVVSPFFRPSFSSFPFYSSLSSFSGWIILSHAFTQLATHKRPLDSCSIFFLFHTWTLPSFSSRYMLHPFLSTCQNWLRKLFFHKEKCRSLHQTDSTISKKITASKFSFLIWTHGGDFFLARAMRIPSQIAAVWIFIYVKVPSSKSTSICVSLSPILVQI